MEHIYIKDSKIGTSVNSNGFYSLSLNKEKPVEIHVSFVGYRSFKKKLLLSEDTVINWKMIKSNELEEVTVVANKKNHQRPVVSQLSIPINELRIMPSLSDETDVMKVFQLMPGVQAGQEGSNALFVRGGSQDQNLFLIDGIPLYYVNHLGGYVSVFDDNAINSMDLLKGGFPARFGGRLSSVTDMHMKDGNTKEYKGEIKLGILSSKLFLEGPVKKNKTSFMISARRSNIDLATRAITALSFNGQYIFGYTFYDLFGKIHHKFSDKHSLYFMAYSGRDRFVFKDNEGPEKDTGFEPQATELFNYHSRLDTKWGNQMAGLRWSFSPAKKLYGNISMAYTSFNYNNEQEYVKKDSTDKYMLVKYLSKYNSGISELTAKADFDYFLHPNYNIKLGIKTAGHEFAPGMAHYAERYDNFDGDTTLGNKAVQTYEANVYAENRFKLGKRLSANIGGRFSLYRTDNKDFFSIQPRAVINFRAADNISFKAAYSNIRQNLHLLSNSSTGVPTDTWLPPMADMPPQSSDQIVFNISLTEAHTNLIIETEGFYKTMANIIDFKDGMSLDITNTDWSKLIETNGTGRAYGAEFLIRKKTGKTTGWLAYTISKTERKFKSINNGKFYPAQYDRRHDFSVVINHQLTKKLSLSATWVYTSGNMMTLSEAIYNARFVNPTQTHYEDNSPEQIQGSSNITAYYYGEKNNYRLPAYHRLDLSLVYKKQKKRGKSVWQLGIYNTYCRKNIFFLYYKNDGKDLYKFTLFPIIPSISYSFKF